VARLTPGGADDLYMTWRPEPVRVARTSAAVNGDVAGITFAGGASRATGARLETGRRSQL